MSPAFHETATTVAIFGGTGDLAVRTDEWDAFAKNLSYVRGDLELPEDYLRLSQHLAAMEAWRIVEPLIDSQENFINHPQRYEPGSWGPSAADALLAETAHSWWQVCGEHGSAHA